MAQMNSVLRRIKLSVGIVLGVAAITAATAQVQIREGSRLYSPTRIEWLCMELNAESKEELTNPPGYSKHFTYSGNDPDTVIVFVRYLPTTDRELLNAVVNNAKQLVELKAKNRGWTWVKVREDVKMNQR